MATNNWKDTAELIGIAAIVASLVFVGLQMRQEQEIAITETFGDTSQSGMDLALEIGAHMDIWRRGLDGEELGESDQGRFDALATAVFEYNQRQFVRWFRLGPIDPDVATSRMAYAMYVFPGLRRAYERKQAYDASLDSARGFPQSVQPWEPSVRHYLDQFDETKPPIPKERNYLFWNM